tara:strand:+ start:72 stop:620 length:549 start_codon:yes stop_codon:yes gene_type:complete
MSTCKRAAEDTEKPIEDAQASKKAKVPETEEPSEDAQASTKAKKAETVWWERLVVVRNSDCEAFVHSISKHDIEPKYWTILEGFKDFGGGWNGVIQTCFEERSMGKKQEKKINAFLEEQVAQESTKSEENTCEDKYTGLGPFDMDVFLDHIRSLCDHRNRVSWRTSSVGMGAAFYVLIGESL